MSYIKQIYIRIWKNINNNTYLYLLWILDSNLSSNMEPVQLDFLVANVTAMVGMEIFWFPIQFGSAYQENEQVSSQKQ